MGDSQKRMQLSVWARWISPRIAARWSYFGRSATATSISSPAPESRQASRTGLDANRCGHSTGSRPIPDSEPRSVQLLGVQRRTLLEGLRRPQWILCASPALALPARPIFAVASSLLHDLSKGALACQPIKRWRSFGNRMSVVPRRLVRHGPSHCGRSKSRTLGTSTSSAKVKNSAACSASSIE
jgi:hypothetical protein